MSLIYQIVIYSGVHVSWEFSPYIEKDFNGQGYIIHPYVPPAYCTYLNFTITKMGIDNYCSWKQAIGEQEYYHYYYYYKNIMTW